MLDGSKLRLVVADDNPSVLEQIASALAEHFDIVATHCDGVSAFRSILDLTPDVAILDLEMPRMNGIDVVRELNKLKSKVAVVIFSIHCDHDLIRAVADAGATGYVAKTGGLNILPSAIRAAAKGERYFPPF